MESIAIVGAGISALSLAHQIQSRFSYQLFEKSSAPGGRVASRTVANQRFDHGAQFFTARSPQFKQFLQAPIAEGHIADWQARFVEIDGNVINSQRQWNENHPHYVGVPDMAALGRLMAYQHPVQLNTEISELIKSGKGWQLKDRQGKTYGPYDWVVATLPAPQTLALLPKTFFGYDDINGIKMKACYALMLSLKADPGWSYEAALVKNADISWISVNSSKPERQGHNLLINSTNLWAGKHLSDDLESVKQHMIDSVVAVTGLDPQFIASTDIKRWVYANLPKQKQPSFYIDPELHLAACGDWCIKGRVEAAFISGYKLGSELKQLSLK